MPLACPRCKSRDALDVQAHVWKGITRDGAFIRPVHSEAIDWNAESRLFCNACKWEGTADAGIMAAAELAAGDTGE